MDSPHSTVNIELSFAPSDRSCWTLSHTQVDVPMDFFSGYTYFRIFKNQMKKKPLKNNFPERKNKPARVWPEIRRTSKKLRFFWRGTTRCRETDKFLDGPDKLKDIDDTIIRRHCGSDEIQHTVLQKQIFDRNAAKCFRTCDTGSVGQRRACTLFFQFFVNRYRAWPFPAITINNVLYEIYELSARSARDTPPQRRGIKLNFVAIRFFAPSYVPHYDVLIP